ncbi:MAG TPA: 7-cyano-7-deazaguanine synthase QueC [Nitrospira sp.]|nr:7-cyano-7-deazaguanine synthase QueC [Nitrospira sp.]
MCAIFGALLRNVQTKHDLETVNKILAAIMLSSEERGRDGWGYQCHADGKMWGDRAVPQHTTTDHFGKPMVPPYDGEYFRRTFMFGNIIGNMRAEPTTEWVKEKASSDQQPYIAGAWSIVHNGTIANDAELRTHRLRTQIDSAAIAELLEGYKPDDRYSIDQVLAGFGNAMEMLVGSYAVLATAAGYDRAVLVSCNYRPVWYITTPWGFFFASSRDYFPQGFVPEMVEPYTHAIFYVGQNGQLGCRKMAHRSQGASFKALVIASGGLDSTVAAVEMIRRGYEVELIHFEYGSRAQGPEVAAVTAIAARLGVTLTRFPLPVYKPADSPLLRESNGVAKGESGAEFAHEWVPARNLILMSVATAYAEANGFDTIVLGNNLEEAGAYPDNEPEFVRRFSDLLPFAVGVNKRMRVEMPVGNLMKHEIVAMGLEIGAPLDLTWSCYHAHDKHCGDCGPCFMRKTAFEINNQKEVIEYER